MTDQELNAMTTTRLELLRVDVRARLDDQTVQDEERSAAWDLLRRVHNLIVQRRTLQQQGPEEA